MIHFLAIVSASLVFQTSLDERMSYEPPSLEAEKRAEKTLDIFHYALVIEENKETKQRYARLVADAYFDLSLRYEAAVTKRMGESLRLKILDYLMSQVSDVSPLELQPLYETYKDKPNSKNLKKLLKVLKPLLSEKTHADLEILQNAFVSSFGEVVEKQEYKRPALLRSIIFAIAVPLALEGLVRVSSFTVKKLWKKMNHLIGQWTDHRPDQWRLVVSVRKTCRGALALLSRFRRPKMGRMIFNPVTRITGTMVLFGFLSYHYWFKSHQPWMGSEEELEDEILPFLEFELQAEASP